jgi:hypothetical protein
MTIVRPSTSLSIPGFDPALITAFVRVSVFPDNTAEPEETVNAPVLALGREPPTFTVACATITPTARRINEVNSFFIIVSFNELLIENRIYNVCLVKYHDAKIQTFLQTTVNIFFQNALLDGRFCQNYS